MKVNIQNALKRALPVLLTLVIAVSALFGGAVRASATESSWLELLDYTTLRDSGSNRGDTNTEIWYDLPFDMDLYAVDILIKILPTGPGYPTGPSVNGITCSMDRIADSIYRIYGSSSALRANQKSVALNFSTVPYPAFIEILSFRVCSVPQQVFNETGTATLNGTSKAMPNGTTPAEITKNDGNTFTGYVSTESWRKYDKVSFSVGVMADSIGSIDVSYGNITAPADISYFQIPGQSRMYYVNVFIDVSNLDKSYAVPLQVRIAGVNTSNVYALTLHRVFGYIDVTSPSPLVFFFNNLFSKLGSWFSGVVNTVSSGFNNVKNWLENGFQSVVNKLDVFINGSQAQQDTADQIQGAVDDYNDQMQGVNRPDVNDDQFDVDTVIGADNLTLSIGLFASIAQNDVASSMIVIVVIFMLGSYVLFGKKA